MNEMAYVPSKQFHRVNRDGGPIVPSKKVMDIVCFHFEVTIEDLLKVCRKREIVYPRQICMYLMAYYTGLTLKSIGVIFSKDHTTVIHSIEAIDNYMLTDENVCHQLQSIIKIITDGTGV